MKQTSTITGRLRFLVLFALSCSRAAGADYASAWRDVRQYAFDTAYATFRKAPGREARLGEAAALLNLQPRTSNNIDRAAGLLDALSAEGHDEIGICAQYLRARLEEVHRSEPRLTEAARRYRELRKSAAHHPLGQQAAVRLTLLELYSSAPEVTPAERVRVAEEFGITLTDPAAIRDHALLLGGACLYFVLPLERAQYHFERALSAGVLNPSNRADLLVSLGEIARELGDRPRAEAAYRSYLKENPHADRSAAIRKRLAELERPVPPS